MIAAVAKGRAMMLGVSGNEEEGSVVSAADGSPTAKTVPVRSAVSTRGSNE
jgi:hypothetical protein